MTRVATSLTTGMHGIELTRFWLPDDFAALLPGRRVSPPTGLTLRELAAAHPKTGPAVDSGFSLASNGCAFQRLHSRVNDSSLLLHHSHLQASCARSAIRSASGYQPSVSTRQARCPSFLQAPELRLPSPLPSGILLPRDRSVLRDLPPFGPPLRNRPISLRSPQPVSITSYGCGSPFRVRYVSARLAASQTSWNLPHYAPDPIRGQSSYVVSATISSNFYCPKMKKLSDHCGAYRVDKSRARSSV